ncbi:MAG: aminotransferase class V-fold PLP-dependent enzyme [Xanthomonadales bacterium]|nr:aminotransferase class V-fold PLP-dependent enzyme [Xanthomonadales bacterium]
MSAVEPTASAVTLDEAFVRAQFPAFSEPSLDGFVHLENAGGSYACEPVIRRLDHFYRRTKLQPYYPSAPSTAGGEAMSEARARWAAWLGVGEDEVHFGPSTSQNTYVLAQALRQWLQPGDEVVVTNQDHETNIGAFARLAEEGFTVREWSVNPETGALDEAGLDRVLTGKTRVVAFTHCSNVVGTIHPAAAWCRKIRDAGALSIVDGVSAAPHGTPWIPSLGADIYLFSLYKVYGPHLGLMTLARRWNERLPNQGHFFNAGIPTARMTPAGPDHAQIAAAAGVIDYFESLDRHHFPDADTDSRASSERVHHLLRNQETRLLGPLLEALKSLPGVRLVGSTEVRDRAPTVALQVEGHRAQALCEALAARGIGTGYGNFYAYRLMEALGIDPDTGVLRCSLVHYNTSTEVEALVAALGELLG